MNEDVGGQQTPDKDKEARKARKLAKQAALLDLISKSGGAFTGFLDDEDEDRTTALVKAAAAEAVTKALEDDAKRVNPNDRPVLKKADEKVETDDDRTALPDYLKSAEYSVHDREGRPVKKTVKLPLSPGGMRGHSVEADRVLDEHVAKALNKSISVNKFPRNFDAGDFCISRYCLAREMYPYEGERAYSRYAPKEAAYYEALVDYGKEYKALGEFTSGTDGGFLAPEIWTNVFFDISGVT